MQKISSQAMRLLRMVSAALSVCFILLLLVMSGISTCTIRGDYHETTFFISAPLLPKICLLALFILALRFLRIRPLQDLLARLNSDERFLEKVRRRCTLILFFAAAFWVCVTQPTVISDQSEIQTAAEQINYHDYSCTMPGGYLSRHQHQIGIVLTAALIQRFVGRDNFLFFQLMNAVMAALTFYYMSRLAQRMRLSGTVQIGILVLGLLFFPYLFYSTFIYATIPSLLLSFAAFDLAARHEAVPGFKTAVLSALSMGFAIFLKQNALIFFIALFIYTVITAWQKRSLMHFLLPVFLVITTISALQLPKPILEGITKTKLTGGITPYAYITMGVQDGDRAPGWYNMYVNTSYGESEYNTELQKEIVLRDLAERLSYFRDNPSDALRFFLQKIASEWNNSTFEAFWINEVRGSTIRPATWVNRISRPTGVDFIIRFLNPLQFLILALALTGLLDRSTDHPNLFYLPLLTFVGGFVFHAVWEAKCQYTLPYFIMLFPYAAYGISVLRKAVCSPVKFFSGLSVGRKACLAVLLFLFVFAAILIARSGILTTDNEAYAAYLSEVRSAK